MPAAHTAAQGIDCEPSASAVFPSDASALCNLLDTLTGQLEFGTDGFEG
jgi:hypothetical protein